MSNLNIPREFENDLSHGNRYDIDAESTYAGFDYDIDAPTLNAVSLLTKDIYRTHDSRDSLLYQRFSQTPLSPSMLYELGNCEYGKAVMIELERRVHETAEETGLPDIYLDAIMREISVESTNRCESNNTAGSLLKRYFMGNTEELSAGEAQLLWRCRTGDANLAETGELLLRYPVIGSVEAMKHTAPLKWGEVASSDIYINKHLDEFKSFLSDPSRIKITEFEKGDPRRLRRPMGPANITHRSDEMPEIIHGTKETLAEVTNQEMVIELVKKQTYILLPATLNLTHVIPNIHTGIHPITKEKVEVNLQPIATMAYWRVKKDATIQSE